MLFIRFYAADEISDTNIGLVKTKAEFNLALILTCPRLKASLC
jgi:hypothetical protein